MIHVAAPSLPNMVLLASDRQVGKSHTGLTLAFAAAAEGERVVYSSADLRYAKVRLYDFLDRYEPLVTKKRLANGEYRVHLGTRGEVLFRSHQQRPFRADTYILDDWDPANWHRLPMEAINAKRLYVALLSETERPPVFVVVADDGYKVTPPQLGGVWDTLADAVDAAQQVRVDSEYVIARLQVEEWRPGETNPTRNFRVEIPDAQGVPCAVEKCPQPTVVELVREQGKFIGKFYCAQHLEVAR